VQDQEGYAQNQQNGRGEAGADPDQAGKGEPRTCAILLREDAGDLGLQEPPGGRVQFKAVAGFVAPFLRVSSEQLFDFAFRLVSHT
jgi:hypothetical protein